MPILWSKLISKLSGTTIAPRQLLMLLAKRHSKVFGCCGSHQPVDSREIAWCCLQLFPKARPGCLRRTRAVFCLDLTMFHERTVTLVLKETYYLVSGAAESDSTGWDNFVKETIQNAGRMRCFNCVLTLPEQHNRTCLFSTSNNKANNKLLEDTGF